MEKQDTKESKGEPAKEHTETEIEVPSKNIHRTFVSPEGDTVKRDDDTSNVLENLYDKISAITGVNYSPNDLAEYIFWTGDEKGVTSAIEEFLDEGIMSRDEAIAFLESIKANLDNIQMYYLKLRKIQNKISSQIGQQNLVEKENVYDGQEEPNSKIFLKNLLNAQKFNEKRMPKQDAYSDLMEHFRVPDFLYSEYTLEEVIYQLAKVMFSQSLTRGSKEAEKALHKFTDFLEKEAEQGQITRGLEKKILAVLVTALEDTLNEKPELYLSASQGFSNLGQHSDLKNVETKRNSSKETARTRQRKA